ncbi:MAG TPA: hypothetical protein VMT00_05640 [Thermoanaerobaculia bacterium]|nr:hypothetical protein [Thermoanaerobaculia bacterium]
MRRLGTTSLLLIPLLLVGCGGSRASQRATLLQPDIQIAQLPGSSFQMQYRGRLSIGYVMEVTNRSSEPIRLVQLQLQTVGGGPYVLQSQPIMINQPVPPDATVAMTFSVWAFSPGGRLASIEPATLRGIAHFDSPEGSFQKIFTQQIVQPRDGARD